MTSQNLFQPPGPIQVISPLELIRNRITPLAELLCLFFVSAFVSAEKKAKAVRGIGVLSATKNHEQLRRSVVDFLVLWTERK